MNKKILTSATSVTLLAALALTGCSTTSNALASGTTADSSVGTTATTSSATATDTAASSSSFSTNVKSGEKLDVDTHYSEQDLSWDTSSETAIDLSNPIATDGVTVEDGTLTITKAGTY